MLRSQYLRESHEGERVLFFDRKAALQQLVAIANDLKH
jgi:hypothetical protein